MKYWLTTHYPHPFPDTHPWHVYLQRHHKGAADGMAVGDRVFFYEYRTAKKAMNDRRLPEGLQGIVRIAKVSGQMYRREAVIDYADGSTGYWSWGVPTDGEDVSGFVQRKDVLAVIDHKPGSVLRGFNGGTGLMELDQRQNDQLLKLFASTIRPKPEGPRR